jgi:hypothetical protein
MCPENTMCENTLSDDPVPKHTVNCIDRPVSNTQTAPGEQSGVYVITNAGSSKPVMRSISIAVGTDIVNASVSGLLEGMY